MKDTGGLKKVNRFEIISMCAKSLLGCTVKISKSGSGEKH